MTFGQVLASKEMILSEGAVIERLSRNPAIDLDQYVLHAKFIYESDLRDALAEIYCEYLDAAAESELPILIQTPTWRASRDRARAAGVDDLSALNRDAVAFMNTLRARYHTRPMHIYVGGLLACRGDAYQPAEGLMRAEALEYHLPQIEALADSGVDFLLAATLPALPEAMGLAEAMAAQSCPYMLSFVLRPTGTLLDGTPLTEAIRRIDLELPRAPEAYLINCTHPTAMVEAWVNFAMDRTALSGVQVEAAATLARVVGLQANTSSQPPEQLDGCKDLAGTDPERFAQEVLTASRHCKLRVLGGCCGTDGRHIRALAGAIRLHGSS